MGSCSGAVFAQNAPPDVDQPTILLAVGTFLAAVASLYQAHLTNKRLSAQNKKDATSSELDQAETAKLEADIALRRKAEAAEGAREVFAGYQALIEDLRKELQLAKKQHREEIEELRAQLRKMAEEYDAP